ncbi:MAG: class I SAM-dependent methyltransferase [Candidatus Asgardarchaeia archaeon]
MKIYKDKRFLTLERIFYDDVKKISNFNEMNTIRHLDRYNEASEFAPQRGMVLDVACGCGYGSLIFKKNTYVGMDISKDAIDFARDKYTALNRSFINFDLNNDILLGNVNFICSIETIEHLDNYEGFLNSCYRNLKPGGGLFLTTVEDIDLDSQHDFHNKGFSVKNMLDICSEIGFSTKKCENNKIVTTFDRDAIQHIFLFGRG